MTPTFKVTQGDLTFRSDFPQPVFDLFRDSWGLQKQLFARMEKHGVRLTDIKPERGSGSLGDLNIVCFLFNFSVTVRVSLERVEILCFDLARVPPNMLNDAGMDALEAITNYGPGVSFKTHTLSLGLHGTLDGISSQDFISRFVSKGPESLGPPMGGGVVFYYGPEAERLTSSVTLDLSALISGGLYVRTQVVWDAQKVAVRSIPGMAEKQVREVVTNLGLKLDGD